MGSRPLDQVKIGLPLRLGGNWSLPRLNRCALYPEHVLREQLPGPEIFPEPDKSKIVLPRPYKLAIVLACFSLFCLWSWLRSHCFVYCFACGRCVVNCSLVLLLFWLAFHYACSSSTF